MTLKVAGLPSGGSTPAAKVAGGVAGGVPPPAGGSVDPGTVLLLCLHPLHCHNPLLCLHPPSPPPPTHTLSPPPSYACINKPIDIATLTLTSTPHTPLSSSSSIPHPQCHPLILPSISPSHPPTLLFSFSATARRLQLQLSTLEIKLFSYEKKAGLRDVPEPRPVDNTTPVDQTIQTMEIKAESIKMRLEALEDRRYVVVDTVDKSKF